MKQVMTNHDIYMILRNEICDFTLVPGSYISEAELTKRFGISRTPIRDIVKKLEYDNLVKVIPNKGTQITAMNFKSILHFMYVREKIEAGLLEDLIPVVSQETIAQLTLIIARQQKALNKDITLLERSRLFYDLDNEFHRCIFSALNKCDVWDFVSQMLPDYARFRTMITEFHNVDDLDVLLSQHKQLLDCIISRDVSASKQLYKDHICGGVNLINQIILEKENYFVI